MVDLAGGCGMRQGEVLGLAVGDVDFAAGVVHVVRQVKLIAGRKVFALPKGGKARTVPLLESVARSLEHHIAQQPPTGASLPWRSVDGSPVTASVLFRNIEGRAVNRVDFTCAVRRPALDAFGVPRGRENGMHALRHFYASVLLDAGESIKALSEYLGHHDPGFTLRTYTHLMPSSERRTREAVNRAFEDGPKSDDGPTTRAMTAPRRPREHGGGESMQVKPQAVTELDVPTLQRRLAAFAAARDWEQYHTPKNLVAALSVEASELVEIFQWLTPEQSSRVMERPETAHRVADEVADVLAYLLQLCEVLGIDALAALAAKIDRNEARFPVPGRPERQDRHSSE